MKFTLPNELGVLTQAAPCHVDWDTMQGDNRVRFCGQCNLNVYNVESLTSFEVRDLLVKNEGKACMRLFQREDGTLITKDCPVGQLLLGRVWRTQKQRARLHFKRPAAVACAAVLSVAMVALSFYAEQLSSLFARNDDETEKPAPRPEKREYLTSQVKSQHNVYSN